MSAGTPAPPQDEPTAPPEVGPSRAGVRRVRRPPVKAQGRPARRRRVERLAAAQEGVVARPQVYAAGLSRAEVRAELRAERWQRGGAQTLVTFSGPLPALAELWVAVLEGGPRAVLDGEASLLASGLTGYESTAAPRVSVPRGARVRRSRRADIRQTRRWAATDRAASGIPRTRPEVAAVRAFLWAVSEARGVLLLTMAVQQGLTSPQRIAEQAVRIRRDRRRTLLHATVLDLLHGARTLTEAEFARECRRRGLPVPTLNERRGPGGRLYVDALWQEWRLVVEIDGVQHSWATHVVADALRQNELALAGDTVLRLPLLGYRATPDDFFAQVERALRTAGCPLPDRPASAAG